ncbi:branched-chain amino acid ABC transporter permease [Antarcticimicrobium luteum]|uniref:branched-chain amino acid ABC transporter permease n=1 Tax=Antarcticimicrobium luteum TaxID=2547397 RepID=UPI0026A3AF5A
MTLFRSILSGDMPRSTVLAVLLALILVGLALAPFLFPGVRTVDTAARICVFIVLVASYDLLLGYGGIVSFAHTMFFGIGAYGVALSLTHLGRGFGAIFLGAGAGAVVAAALALLIGLFSLRVRAIFFAMITLAVASAVAVLVSQLSGLTGGEDGLTFKLPRELGPAFKFGKEALGGELFGVKLNGKLLAYYFVFAGALVLFLMLLRVVNSPFGRVLLAIRENDFRAEAIGYRVVYYRVAATCLSAAAAALAGSLYAIWLRYVGPETTLSMELMIDILLMVVIGGMGTMYGAVIGATLFVLAQNYLQTLMGAASGLVEGLPVLPELLSADRWLLWLGVLFILSVYFFPTGIVGRLRGGK